MGTLPKSRIEKVMLPSTASKPVEEQDWIELNTNPVGGDIMATMGDGDLELSSSEKTEKLLASLITGWSFTEDDGKPVPVTAENVHRLPFVDLSLLGEKIEPALSGGMPEKKDEILSTSLPEPATDVQ